MEKRRLVWAPVQERVPRFKLGARQGTRRMFESARGCAAGTRDEQVCMQTIHATQRGRAHDFERGEAISIKPMITKTRPTHRGSIRIVEMDLTGDDIVQLIKTAPLAVST